MVFSMPIPPKPPWHSTPTANESLPAAAPNCNSLIESPTDAPATEKCKNKSYDNIENDRPDDDNDNNNNDDDDDDVDCFPRQDKQPILPQDITPTASTATANNTSPSLIETHTDKSTDNDNDRRRPNTQQPTHKSTQASYHADVPLLVWDGTQYQLDYNHNQRPISTWNGTTHTDIVYDDDDDDDDDDDGRTAYDYAYGDPFNMNDPSNQLQFTQCLKTVQFNN